MSHESSRLTHSSSDALDARRELFEILKGYPATDEELERSLGLFIRGSLLARIVAIQEIYAHILTLPGSIADLGTWRGQTAVLCENLRAINEPLNFYRRIFCFDTFDGYRGFSEGESKSGLQIDGSYDTGGASYALLLARLLGLHERSNAMGHINNKHSVIQGDVRETLPAFLKQNPSILFSLVFFDLNAYVPTKDSLEALWDRIPPGGVAAFWQLQRQSLPGEGMVYLESIIKKPHVLNKCRSYPSLCYLIKI